MTEYQSNVSSFFGETDIKYVENSEQSWIDVIRNGGIIIADEGWYTGFQRLESGKYCFFGTSHYGDLIYKVF